MEPTYLTSLNNSFCKATLRSASKVRRHACEQDAFDVFGVDADRTLNDNIQSILILFDSYVSHLTHILFNYYDKL